MSQLKDRYDHVVEFTARQLRHLIETYPNYFPVYTVGGKWFHTGERWTNWCEGFLAGQLWLIYLHTGDTWWRNKAEHYSLLIEPRKTDRTIHDLGFLFLPTWKRWYDLTVKSGTADPKLNQVVIDAAQTLALRYQEKGGYLCSFMGESSLFIDIMANIGLIFYAAQQARDDRLWQIAVRHCQTTRRYLVRGDGSVAHEGIFDTQTGEFLRQDTHQGWRKDSAWARGLAWALYGFATAFLYTKNPGFLSTAEACAHFYIAHTPPHGIPPNDWDEPNPTLPYESSAAAIAANGFWNLSFLTGDPTRALFYRQYALRILDTLSTSEFLAVETPGWEGILKHGIYHQRKGLGVDESVMWGDYFLLEAISRVRGLI